MDGHYHNWPVTCWGIIIGLAKCKICGVTSTNVNINEWCPTKTIDNQEFKSDKDNPLTINGYGLDQAFMNSLNKE